MQPQSGQTERPRGPAAGRGACAAENPEFGTGKGKKDPCQYQEKSERGQSAKVPLVVTLKPPEGNRIQGHPTGQRGDPEAQHNRAMFFENPDCASDAD